MREVRKSKFHRVVIEMAFEEPRGQLEAVRIAKGALLDMNFPLGLTPAQAGDVPFQIRKVVREV